VDTLLVVGTTVAGLFVGGVLDPVGQRLADRSRLDDERRRAELLAESDDRPATDDGPASAVDRIEGGLQDALGAAEADDADDPVPAEADVGIAHLLPSGPAPVRTAAAAVVTGALFAGAAAHFGRDLVLAPFCVFFALLVVISVTDLSHRLVPRRLLYPALVLIAPLLVATSAVDHSWNSLTGSVIAGATAFILFFGVWWFVPRGMGFGDVRLSGVIGLSVGYLSLLHTYVAFLAGFVIGMLFGLALMGVSSAGRKTRIPFAPSLAAGAVLAVFWGGHIAQGLFHAGG
jgi:leader peptidase (prepilin peptidase)/N-methyltransferase